MRMWAFRCASHPKNLPTAIVRKINQRVQYSSHVVNLVVNNFSNARVSASDESAFAFVRRCTALLSALPGCV